SAARLAFETGQIEAARVWLHAAGPTPVMIGLESLAGSPTLTRAALLVAMGDPGDLAEASATLDALEAATGLVNDAVLAVGVRAGGGLVPRGPGDLDAALRHIGEAVSAATPGRLLRTFVDLGPSVRDLLAELAQRSAAPDPYLANLLAAFPSPG